MNEKMNVKFIYGSPLLLVVSSLHTAFETGSETLTMGKAIGKLIWENVALRQDELFFV